MACLMTEVWSKSLLSYLLLNFLFSARAYGFISIVIKYWTQFRKSPFLHRKTCSELLMRSQLDVTHFDHGLCCTGCIHDIRACSTRNILCTIYYGKSECYVNCLSTWMSPMLTQFLGYPASHRYIYPRKVFFEAHWHAVIFREKGCLANGQSKWKEVQG